MIRIRAERATVNPVENMMHPNTNPTKSGFTLVEVVVATAILSIMAAITLISINGNKINTEAQAGTRLVASAIREAQNYALTGKNITSDPNKRPCRFRARTAGSVIFVEQLSAGMVSCPEAGATPDAWEGGSRALPQGVTASGAEVRFDVPRGEPTNAAGTELSGTLSIDFSVSKSSVTARVCVYPLGRVDEKPVGSSC